MKTLTLLLGLSAMSIANAQQTYTPKQIQEDFTVLKTAICEVSPNLSIAEKKQCYQTLDKRQQSLPNTTITALDFFRFLSKRHEHFNLDEHVLLCFPFAKMGRLLTASKSLFPIPIVLIDQQLVVNCKTCQLPFGSTIKTINNKTAQQIIQDFIRTNSTYDQRNIESVFDLMYFIHYGATTDFVVEYQAPNTDKTQKIKLSAIGLKQRQTQQEKTVYPLNKQMLNQVVSIFVPPQSDIFYLQLNSFSAPDGQADEDYFYPLFTNIFDEIKRKKIKNLVIDLRYNGGGNITMPSMLYYFIAKDAFEEKILLSMPDFDFPYQQYITAIDCKKMKKNSLANLLEGLKKDFVSKDAHYEYVMGKKVDPSLNKQRFTGNVYLLVGGRTFSAATYFTSLFKTFNRGTIIGEQVGGSHHKMTAGKRLTYTLPNTKIELGMPIALMQLTDKITKGSPRKYIQPDITVSEKAKLQYLLKQQDWDIEETINRINQDEKQ